MKISTQKYLTLDIDGLSDAGAKKAIQELTSLIHHHNKLYYELWTSKISDGEYDQLFALLQQLESRYPEYVTKNSPTQKVWWFVVSEWFVKAAHPVPLISLSNSYNAQDIRDWHTQLTRIADKEGIQSRSYIVEPKLDGSSVEIVYRYGEMVQAITRWDGQQGEDITTNVKMLRNLPLHIAGLEKIAEIRLRGEILLPQAQFDIINTKLAEQGQQLFANPRNAAAGTLRQLDSNIVYERGLVIFVYDILRVESEEFRIQSDIEQLERLATLWLPVYPRHKICESVDEVVRYCEDETLIQHLEDANVEMDGLVIKVNEIAPREIRGQTEHHPRWAMAFKFPTKQVAAKLLDITYQVWRTGAITPVAELDPVALWWVTVSRATLHNFDYIADRDIRKGDRVWVQRSGEVIPYIIGPIESRRDGSEEAITLLQQCPSCETDLVQLDGEVALLCPSDTCQAKLIQQLQHFVAKNSLNINGLGNSIVELLVQHGLIDNIPDLYTLEERVVELRSLQGMWDKKIATILAELELTKTKNLRRWIHGFGIKYVGKKISQDLEKAYTQRLGHRHPERSEMQWSEVEGSHDQTDILEFFADSEYLETVFGLGTQTIQALSKRANNEKNQDTISSLIAHWVLFSSTTRTTPSNHPQVLWGKKFVITGSFSWYSRDTLAEIISQHGGEVTSSVSKNTDYLLCGDKAGSKLAKAESLWVTVVSLSEFGQLIWEIIEQKNSTVVEQGGLF